MTTLADFLLARIAEDEADAEELLRQYERWQREKDRNGPDGAQGSIIASLIDPARVLAECDAKRRIVTECGWVTVMALLALPYADHPDYRQEWKP